MFYPYDKNSAITSKSATQPTGDYCISDEDFDLDLNIVYVGAVDANKNLTHRTVRAKPAEVLVQNIKNQNQIISELQTIAGVNSIDTSTLDGAKQAKLREIATACQTTIYAGVDVVDTKGTEHFSLTSDDQANLSALALSIGTGLTSVPYHANGKLCREFTASEFNSVYTAAKNFVTYNTTLCNHLNVWIRRCTTISDVQAITYASTLPNDLLTNFNTIMGITA